jgi:hypothetical protein
VDRVPICTVVWASLSMMICHDSTCRCDGHGASWLGASGVRVSFSLSLFPSSTLSMMLFDDSTCQCDGASWPGLAAFKLVVRVLAPTAPPGPGVYEIGSCVDRLVQHHRHFRRFSESVLQCIPPDAGPRAGGPRARGSQSWYPSPSGGRTRDQLRRESINPITSFLNRFNQTVFGVSASACPLTSGRAATRTGSQSCHGRRPYLVAAGPDATHPITSFKLKPFESCISMGACRKFTAFDQSHHVIIKPFKTCINAYMF